VTVGAEPPETRYAKVGGGQVAYQVFGDGPNDLVWCAGMGSQIELDWHVPPLGHFLSRLASVGRFIHFDRRGTGGSDPVPLNALPTWEEYAEDLSAVLDIVQSRRAAVIGFFDGGPIALLFASMHPERVSHLILINTGARFIEADDYLIGISSSLIDELIPWIAANWGSDDFTRALYPTLAEDAETRAAIGRMFRGSMTPMTAAGQMEYILRNLDVRRFLPLVQVPTLILHARDSSIPPVACGRYLAEHIPVASLVEYAGSDLWLGPLVESVPDIVEFLTGERPPTDIDRVLTTVLFTDIAGSTERAASLGDQKWRSILDAHDRAVREQLRRFGGREIKTTGDGFLVSFDGPARAIRCARAITGAVGTLGVEVRAGLHTGECDVRGEDLGGLAVHIASRVGSTAKAGEVLVSGTVKDLVVGSDLEFEDRGEHELKGVPGSWRLFAVRG
jgi:class 3 adenylate cyclase